MSLAVSEEPLEAASAAAAVPIDAFKAIWLGALDDAQRWASEFFEFSKTGNVLMFEHLERATRARSIMELTEIWSAHAQDQLNAMLERASQSMAARTPPSPATRPLSTRCSCSPMGKSSLAAILPMPAARRSMASRG